MMHESLCFNLTLWFHSHYSAAYIRALDAAHPIYLHDENLKLKQV